MNRSLSVRVVFNQIVSSDQGAQGCLLVVHVWPLYARWGGHESSSRREALSQSL